ncbi:MAG: hypothetical protein CTY13_01155 [Methylobacter sp.]|nr:MAG: hypothetical protein CTY13_01155 [Methylobacter sp.]
MFFPPVIHIIHLPSGANWIKSILITVQDFLISAEFILIEQRYVMYVILFQPIEIEGTKL